MTECETEVIPLFFVQLTYNVIPLLLYESKRMVEKERSPPGFSLKSKSKIRCSMDIAVTTYLIGLLSILPGKVI